MTQTVEAPYGRDEDGIEICRGRMAACRCSICDMKYWLWREENIGSLEREAKRYEYSDRVIKDNNRRKT